MNVILFFLSQVARFIPLSLAAGRQSRRQTSLALQVLQLLWPGATGGLKNEKLAWFNEILNSHFAVKMPADCVGCVFLFAVRCCASDSVVWTSQMGGFARGDRLYRGGDDAFCCLAGKKKKKKSYSFVLSLSVQKPCASQPQSLRILFGY